MMAGWNTDRDSQVKLLHQEQVNFGKGLSHGQHTKFLTDPDITSASWNWVAWTSMHSACFAQGATAAEYLNSAHLGAHLVTWAHLKLFGTHHVFTSCHMGKLLFSPRVWTPAQVLQRIPAATPQPFREWPPQTRCPKFWILGLQRSGKKCSWKNVLVRFGPWHWWCSAVSAQGLMIFGGAQVSIELWRFCFKRFKLKSSQTFTNSDFDIFWSWWIREWNGAWMTKEHVVPGSPINGLYLWHFVQAPSSRHFENSFFWPEKVTLIWYLSVPFRFPMRHFFLGQAFPVVPVLRPMWTRRGDVAFQRWGGEALTRKNTKQQTEHV